MTLYEQSDIDAARVNTKRREDCSRAVQQLFYDCPYGQLLRRRASSVSWDPVDWDGPMHHAIYRIAKDWPPQTQTNDSLDAIFDSL
jgi:hypothetical protein